MSISCKTDNSGVTIGKKYARTDEIGIPFGITVDKDTLTERSVTLREIETTKQIRIPVF
jgi:glycyl-tRNA synthetase